MQAVPDPHSSGADKDGTVQAKCFDCGTTHGRSSDHSGFVTAPAEVIEPRVGSWIEERNEASAPRVECLGSGLLEVVAPEATPTQVVEGYGPAKRFGEDVIHGEVVPRVFRARATVLAQPVRPLFHPMSESRRHPAHESRSRAAVRRSNTSSLSCSRASSSRCSARVSRRCLLSANNSSVRCC